MSKPESSPKLRSVVKPTTVLLLFLLFSSFTHAQTAPPKFRTAPDPDWVLSDTPAPSTASRDGTITPWVRLLDDQQIRIRPDGLERYFRKREQAVSEKGVESVSTLYFPFDPAFQTLVVHHIRIIRGGQTLDVLRPGEITVESDDPDEYSLETTLKEARKDDIIDYAYTLRGADPGQAGRFAETLRLGLYGSTDRVRRRVLWPGQQKLYWRTRNTSLTPSVRSLGTEVEYLWGSEPPAPCACHAEAPPWFDPRPEVQLSDFATWQEVAELASSWYRVPMPLAPPLARRVEEWKKRLPADEPRLLAAVRFVQDEIRDGGEQGMHPSSPTAVFEKREGSSRDRALLLCTLLRGLGIEAAPALVNSTARHVIEEYQPSLAAFDSVLVRVSLGNLSYWFDPSQTHQRGPLRQHANPPYARALLLQPGSRTLVEIPGPPVDSSSVFVKETYRASTYKEPVAFDVITTYRGIAADEMRRQLSWLKLEDYAKQKRDHYSDDSSTLAAEGEPQVSDDQEKNELVITERYHLSKFWRGRTVGFRAEQVAEKLAVSRGQSTGPLKLYYPLDFRQVIELHTPEPLRVAGAEGVLDDGALRLSYKISADPRVITLDCRLQSLRSFVDADQTPQHLKFREQLTEKLSMQLTHSGDPLMLSYVIEYWPFVTLGVLLLIGLFLLLW